jgi:hypothetical protein
MTKNSKNKKIPKRKSPSSQRLRSLWQRIRELPQLLLLKKIKLIQMGIMTLVFGIAIVLMILLLVVNPNVGELTIPPRQVILDRDSIDNLEFWIEQRQAGFDKPLAIDDRNYFIEPTALP